jgi:DNA-binding transcriptional ArsR family regulator
VSWPTTSMPPDIEAIAEQVFTALADPTRRAILAALASGGPATATDLAGRLPVTRQAIAKHLALLAEAGLVTAEPGERRRVRYRLHSAPMQVAQQFLAALARDWDGPLDALTDHLDRVLKDHPAGLQGHHNPPQPENTTADRGGDDDG